MISVLNRNLIKTFSFVKKISQSMTASIQRAKRVQQNVLEQNYAIQNQAKLKRKVNFDTSVQELQQQLNGQIARALRKSQDKVKYLIQKTQKGMSIWQKNLVYHQLTTTLDKQKRQHQIEKYNQMVGLCEKARWQFMIHRQSCGFTLRNHQLVHSLYKIPPRIIV